jgi:hypothetical protein
MSNLSKKIIEQIQKHQIKPIPKWRFIIQNICIWALIFAAIFAGSIAVGMLLRDIFLTNWDFAPNHPRGLFRGMIKSIPFLWLFISSAFGFAALKLIQITPKAYKLKTYQLFLLVSVGSLLIGSITFAAKISDRLEKIGQERFEIYKNMRQKNQNDWHFPEKGFFQGEIIKIDSRKDFAAKDPGGKNWRIISQDKKFIPQVGLEILANGESTEALIFKAKKIRPNCQKNPEACPPKVWELFFEKK